MTERLDGSGIAVAGGGSGVVAADDGGDGVGGAADGGGGGGWIFVGLSLRPAGLSPGRLSPGLLGLVSPRLFAAEGHHTTLHAGRLG